MDDEQKGTHGGGSGLGVILLTVFLDIVGFSIIFPLFPEMLAYYLGAEGTGGLLGSLLEVLGRLSGGGDPAQAELYTQVLFGGVLGSIYSVLQFVAAPMWGALSDRIGRRQVLLWTISGIAISYALWVVAGSFALLLAARVVGGAMSGNISVATAVVADVTDARSRTKAMGMLGAVFGVGFIVGPAIGGGLSAIDLTGPLSFVPGINPFSAPALAAMILSVWNLVWVATRLRESTDASQRERRGGRPINPIVLLRPTGMAGVDRTNLVYFVFILAFAGMEFTLTFLARDRFAYDSRDNVMIFLFVGVIAALVQGGVVRRLAPKLGERALVRAGFALLMLSLVIIGRADEEGELYAGLAMLSIGMALASPSLTSLVSLYAPEDRQGELIGVYRSLGALGRAVGPLIACLAYWKYGGQWPYLGGAAIVFAALILAFGLPETAGARQPGPRSH